MRHYGWQTARRAAAVPREANSFATRDDAAGKEQELRQQRHEAIQAIREIAKEAGSWPATKIVHDWRYRLMKEDH
jgi:hypothetical protein